MKTRLVGAAVLLLFVCIAAAGCISSGEIGEPAYSYVPIPEEMDNAMLYFVKTMQQLDMLVSTDLYTLADRVGGAEDTDEIQKILTSYYADNVWLERVIFYDNTSGSYITAPLNAEKIVASIPHPTEEELTVAGGMLNTGPVYLPEQGYMNLMYAPAFTQSGEYRGYVLFVFSSENIVEAHPAMENEDNPYRDYAILFMNANNVISYAVSQELTGTKVNGSLQTRVGLVTLQTEERGAYADNGGILGWQKYAAHKTEYTLYLKKTGNTSTAPFPAFADGGYDVMKKAVEDAWMDGLQHSEMLVLKKISKGMYSYPLYAFNMNGTILAAPPENSYSEGRNFLTVRDSYGVTVMEHAVFIARQGGGFGKCMIGTEAVPEPEEGNFLLLYELPGKGDWFIVGFAQTEGKPVKLREDIWKSVHESARECLVYSGIFGPDALIRAVSASTEPTAETLFGENAVAVISYTGILQAASDNPQLEGSSITGYTDIFGSSVVRRAIMLAKEGGGMVYDYQLNKTQPGYCDLWLCSVQPVNDDYFVMSRGLVSTLENVVNEEDIWALEQR